VMVLAEPAHDTQGRSRPPPCHPPACSASSLRHTSCRACR
jgi:hypothetical protein